MSDQYRKLYLSQAVAGLGRQLIVVTAAYQVFVLTDSSFAVGLLGLFQLVPLLLCSFLGGALVDAFDRRKLLLGAQGLLFATSVALALNAGRDRPAVWVVFAATGIAAGLSAIDGPASASAIPRLVGRDQVTAAQALHQVQTQLSVIVGPALAGLLIAQISVAAAYWLHVVGCLLTIAALRRISAIFPEGGGSRPSFRAVREGLAYARRQPVILGVMAADLNAMLLGMPRALFPELGTGHLGGGPATVGLLYAAPGVGALCGALSIGWIANVRHHGRGVIAAIAVWGIAISVFGLVPFLPIALLMLAVAGSADVVSTVLRSTIIQLETPDRLRGRLWSLNIAIISGGPRLGDLRAGAMSAAVGPRISALSGGLACTAGIAALARLLPELRSWSPRKRPAGDQYEDDPNA